VRRIGKRIVLAFNDDLFVVIHLMIAGRLRWREPKQKAGVGPKLILASFEFPNGTLLFTEASSKKRASLQDVRGEDALRALDPGGIEPLDATLEQFHEAVRGTLALWTDRLREQTGGGFPEKVTAFRDEMAVHGRYKQPCPVCGTPVQRIVYADNECNYCARCQTGGRLLADRSLSRLLKSDWPRSIDEV